MGAVPAEAMSIEEIEEEVVGIFQDVRRVVRAGQALPTVDHEAQLSDLRKSIGGLDLANLARLAVGERPQSDTPEGLAANELFVDAKRLWLGEEATLRVAELALPFYIEEQDARVAELLDGGPFTVARREDSPLMAIATLPEEGSKPITGPVTGSFVVARTEASRLFLQPDPDTEPEVPTQLGYNVTVLNTEDQAQVDIKVNR